MLTKHLFPLLAAIPVLAAPATAQSATDVSDYMHELKLISSATVVLNSFDISPEAQAQQLIELTAELRTLRKSILRRMSADKWEVISDKLYAKHSRLSQETVDYYNRACSRLSILNYRDSQELLHALANFRLAVF